MKRRRGGTAPLLGECEGGGNAKVRQGRDEGVCGALPSVRVTWAGRADVGAGLASVAHAMGAAVAEEEDGSDGQGPRASESEWLNGLTSGLRGTVREGNTCEGSWRQQIGPTGQREGGVSGRGMAQHFMTHIVLTK